MRRLNRKIGLLGVGFVCALISLVVVGIVYFSKSPSSKGKESWRPASIVNEGNYCYRNAMFQVLMRLPTVHFCQFVQPNKNQPLIKAACAAQKQKDSVSTLRLNAISANLPAPFNDNSQQDTDHFLQTFVATLRKEVVATAVDLFDAMFDMSLRQNNRYECTQCGQGIQRQALLGMQLGLEALPPRQTDKVQLTELLEMYLQRGHEVVRCPGNRGCGIDAVQLQEQDIDEEQLPEILRISLPRFLEDGVRVPNLIEAPLNGLRLLPQFGPSYRLVGVVDTHGATPEGGHYVSTVRIGEDWWFFNDAATPKKVAPDQVVTNSAYVLFYQKEMPLVGA